MKWKSFIVLLMFPILQGQEPAIAHGAKANYRMTSSIEIQAKYDSGQPMKNAQVTIYSPVDPNQPWTKGVTDEKGYFWFTPDYAQTGYWEVKVRQAGHGALISIPIDSNVNQNSQNSGVVGNNQQQFSPLQKALMIGSVIWGSVGTALFFYRGKQINSSAETLREVSHQESKG